VATAEAKEKWLKVLQEQLQGLDVRVTPVDIPRGVSEKELWVIFDAMAKHLQVGDRVAFDITHSFRTLPMLALIAAAYLRVVREVQIEGIYYGAYEARDVQTNESPVFDLTPFLQLLDWTAAAHYFQKTMDGRFLGELLSGIQQTMRRGRTSESIDLPTKLKSAGLALVKTSQAVQLTQPYAVMDCSEDVLKKLESARQDVEKYARPFAVLLETVRQAHAPLALKTAEQTDMHQALSYQWRLLDGYFQRGQVVQAATLAREWIVNILCWKLQKNSRDKQERDSVEKALNSITGPKKRQTASEDDELIRSLQEMGWIEEVRSVWDTLADVRNQIAHCGMLEDAVPCDRLHKNVLEQREKLRTVAITFELTAIEGAGECEPS
jgi:CRISPR-associated DxTHG motif protein